MEMASNAATSHSGYCNNNRTDEVIPIARKRMPLSLIQLGFVRSFTIHKVLEAVHCRKSGREPIEKN
jgi:hypothetical protein